MIYTVTFNPAIDYVVRLDAPLEVGEVNRAKGEDCVLGGKGINVSGVLAELGCRNTALGFVAGETGAWLERGLAAQGITTDFIHLEQGMTRINVKIKAGQETELNGAGPDIPESAMEQLETLYEQFNLKKPVDFHSPSLSVSDIVAIKQDGKVSCHYCDSVGFTEIPGFLPDNPLKNAEMMLEDDYGMIDGIINNGPKEPTVAQLEQQARSGQPISLMDLAEAVHREERDKKKSVMEQLKSQPRTEHKKTAPKKSAEREI